MKYLEMVTWHCPMCDNRNEDIINQNTHCGACGEVVWVGDEDELIDDEGWKVPMEKQA